MYAGASSSKGPVPFQVNRGFSNRSHTMSDQSSYPNGVMPMMTVSDTLVSPSGKNWTLWTIRDPLLTGIFGPDPKNSKEVSGSSRSRVRMARKEIMTLVDRTLSRLCSDGYSGLSQDFIAVSH